MILKPLLCFTLTIMGLRSPSLAEMTDHRDAQPKDLNGYFPFAVPDSVQAWGTRGAGLRKQVQVALGLYPLPARTPLNAVIHGRRDMGDYYLEKAYFQSFPGVYVTGSLYRPKQVTGKSPAVLCPHGHWENGRFLDEPEGAVNKALASRAEQFTCAARSPLQARCVQLARMGCVVFHYDMLGYADSQQVSFATAHKYALQENATLGGFFTPEAEGHLQSILGLQTWNGIRALDFLESLPEVDSTRLGVTGASGGGTQTFLLCAVDDRPAAAFPAVMVSTAMQGGCTCENASLLRIGTGNVELAALFAPKPLGMSCAEDWTKEMLTKGYPELQQLYKLLGKPDLVSLTDTRPHPHNYNHVARVGMEQWFAKHLLHAAEAPPEREFTFQTAADLTVWDEAHPAPDKGPAAERMIIHEWKLANQAALSMAPAAIANGWKALFQRTLETTGKCAYTLVEKAESPNYFKIIGDAGNETHQEQVRVTFLHPKAWRQRVVVWCTSHGAAGMFSPDGQPTAEVAEFLKQGWAVAGPDLRLQSPTPATQNRRVQNPREAAAYTYGYNDPLLVQRVHDVLTVVKMIQTNPDYTTEKIAIVADNDSAGIAAGAACMAGVALCGCVFDDGEFSFSKLANIYDVNFLPGALKFGDMPALAKLANGKCEFKQLLAR